MQRPLFVHLEIETIYAEGLYQLMQWKQWLKNLKKQVLSQFGLVEDWNLREGISSLL